MKAEVTGETGSCDYHLAKAPINRGYTGQSNVTQYLVRDFQISVKCALSALEFAKRVNAKLIYSSLCTVYGNPIKISPSENHPLNPISSCMHPCGLSKKTAEDHCHMYHFAFRLPIALYFQRPRPPSRTMKHWTPKIHLKEGLKGLFLPSTIAF